jgi:hypothetical protein
LNNTRLVRLSTASVLVPLPQCDHYLMFHQHWAGVATQQVLWLLANVTGDNGTLRRQGIAP